MPDQTGERNGIERRIQSLSHFKRPIERYGEPKSKGESSISFRSYRGIKCCIFSIFDMYMDTSLWYTIFLHNNVTKILQIHHFFYSWGLIIMLFM